MADSRGPAGEQTGHDLFDQHGVDPVGDAPELRVLLGLDLGQPRFELRAPPEGLFPRIPQEGVLVALHRLRGERGC